MPYTTTANVSDWMGRDFTAEELHRVAHHIAWAERYAARAAGWCFYDPNDTGSAASLSWIEAVSRLAERAILQDDPEDRKNAAGAYASVKISDYQWTARPGIREEDIRTDTAITEILEYYAERVPVGAVLLANGPTRNRTPEYDPDVNAYTGDVSRGWIPY